LLDWYVDLSDAIMSVIGGGERAYGNGKKIIETYRELFNRAINYLGNGDIKLHRNKINELEKFFSTA
jgi:hypothetical protein